MFDFLEEDGLRTLDCNMSDISCGVHQLSAVREIDFKSFKKLINGDMSCCGDYSCLKKGQTYLFSDSQGGNGRKMAGWIQRHNLGSLTSTPWRLNPNSGNKIKVWVWRYNGRKIK